MPAIELFVSPIVSVEYFPEENYIQHTVHQPVAGHEETFKEGLMIGVEAMHQYEVTKYLADDRRIGPVPSDLINWGMTDWQTGMLDAGWEYWANVVPAEVGAAGSLVPLINELHQRGLRMRVFSTVDDGVEWLNNIE